MGRTGEQEITVDKGVPIPSSKFSYPWDKMAVGTSFWVEKKAPTMSALAGQTGRRLNMKFRVKTEIKNGKVGTRVWRIE